MKRLIVIPAYNEADTIVNLIEEIRETAGTAFDIAVVNDCSSDDTAEVCRQQANVVLLDLPFNLGIGGAVQTGYRYAWEQGYDIVVQVDADGQHDPAYLADLIAPLEQGFCDMSIGTRFLAGEGFQSTGIRRLGIRFFQYLIFFLMGQVITDPTSGFRACNRQVIRLFSRDYPRDYPEPETNARLLRLGYRIREVSVKMRERQGGASSIRLKQAVYYMVKVTLAIFIDRLRSWNRRDGEA